MITCKECGATSADLITDQDGVCAHCAIESRKYARPELEREGYFDISTFGDGGVMKKVLSEGVACNFPILEAGCPCSVQYVGRLLDGTIFDTTRDKVDGKYVGGTDDPFEFKLLRGEWIKGMDLAVLSMAKGEVASFIFAPEYAYKAAGLEPKVGPNTFVQFEVELVSWKDSLPWLPTQKELESSRKKREEEERAQQEANPPPAVSERVGRSHEERERGNKLFAEGKMKEAKEAYDMAFVNIFYSDQEFAYLLSPEEQELIRQTKLVLHLNRGLCKLRMMQLEEAFSDCKMALDIDGENAKGLFRRGRVQLEMLKEYLTREERGEFWDVEKATQMAASARADFERAIENTAGEVDKAKASVRQIQKSLRQVGRIDARLARERKKVEREATKFYRDKMFGALNEKYQSRMAAERERQESDLPPLEDVTDEEEEED